MKDKGILATKYKADRPNVDPSSVVVLPDPSISNAIAVKKLKNRTKQYTEIKSKWKGKLRLEYKKIRNFKSAIVTV